MAGSAIGSGASSLAFGGRSSASGSTASGRVRYLASDSPGSTSMLPKVRSSVAAAARTVLLSNEGIFGFFPRRSRSRSRHLDLAAAVHGSRNRRPWPAAAGMTVGSATRRTPAVACSSGFAGSGSIRPERRRKPAAGGCGNGATAGGCGRLDGRCRKRPDRRRHGSAAGPRFLQLRDFVFNRGDDLFVLFGVFEEIGNVKEGIALETDVHERGLHARQDFRYLTFIDVADDALRSMPLDVKLNEFVVFQDGNFGFLEVVAMINSFCIETPVAVAVSAQGHVETRRRSGKSHVLSWKTPVPGGALCSTLRSERNGQTLTY